MKPLHLVLVLPCVLFGFPAVAEQPLIEPQTQGEVSFISGGVGSDEQKAMQAVRAKYNLCLLFSEKGTGEYLSGVKVNIANPGGHTFLETVSDGPMLFAKLKPGRYVVTVDQAGHLVQRTAAVGVEQKTSLSFTWPRQESD